MATPCARTRALQAIVVLPAMLLLGLFAFTVQIHRVPAGYMVVSLPITFTIPTGD
jgi:hypothetical protein